MSFFAFASLILLCMQATIGLWFYFLFPVIGWKTPAVLSPLVMTALMYLTIGYTRTHYGTIESLLYFLAYAYGGLVFIVFFIVAAFALLQGFCALLHLPTKSVLGPVSLGCIVLACILSLYGGRGQPHIKHIDIVIPGAPEMTAAIISDSHLGVGVSLARWQKALARLQEQNPDAVWVLGDVFEYGANRAAYAQALANVQTKYGTFGVLGNHECHQPSLTDTAAQHELPLMLSGHTHNGQIFPFNFFVRMVYPYVYGLYQMGPKSQIYVTSGMFYWGVPLRFLAPAEIPILHIKNHA